MLGAEKNVVEECWLLRKMGGGGGEGGSVSAEKNVVEECRVLRKMGGVSVGC